MHIIYLHGFASSAQSTKANLFRPQFEERGFGYSVPDLNVPDFQHLTLTAMLERVAETVRSIAQEPIYLVGSSMGGLTALHFYDRYRDAEASRIQKMILLAPAFDFMDIRGQQMGADWEDQWRDAGSMPFFNYATGGEVPVHYGLVADIKQYDSYAVQVDIPTLIYHGKKDQSVPYDQSTRFAEGRQHVTLHLLDSDHQLLDQTEEIFKGILAFITEDRTPMD
ncbi:MAG: alpha/beta fold hydrolase [Anaerolineae bacterium]|nr:alpha/beta fold hydrolase [Anaerolineae bacterium]